VFLTRSPYGLWVFADALGKARQAWLRVLGAVEDEEVRDVLFTLTENMEWLIEAEEKRAQVAVANNLRALAGRLSHFKLVDHALDVYGDAYGLATDSSVSDALQALKRSGEIIIHQNASRLRERVVGPGPSLRPTQR